MEPLTTEEQERYARHLVLPEFGTTGQARLKAARVLVVGVGGLGSPVLLYLAAAGVGTLGLVDYDVVSRSNLQRQVLFGDEDIGQPKVAAAAARLRALNPLVDLHLHPAGLTRANALELVAAYDVVVDATDNFPTRYLLNDACVLCQKPYIYGAIFRFEGQVAVFNHQRADGSWSCNYRNFFPAAPPPELAPNCATSGVLGVLPGIIGSMQANEAIKILTGIGTPLIDQLFLFDAAAGRSHTLQLPPQPPYLVTELPAEEWHCKPPDAVPTLNMATWRHWQKTGKPHQLIDVRQPEEYQRQNLGGLLLPLGELLARVDAIRQDCPVVIHCQSGQRAQAALALLQQRFGWTHLLALQVDWEESNAKKG